MELRSRDARIRASGADVTARRAFWLDLLVGALRGVAFVLAVWLLLYTIYGGT